MFAVQYLTLERAREKGSLYKSLKVHITMTVIPMKSVCKLIIIIIMIYFLTLLLHYILLLLLLLTICNMAGCNVHVCNI